LRLIRQNRIALCHQKLGYKFKGFPRLFQLCPTKIDATELGLTLTNNFYSFLKALSSLFSDCRISISLKLHHMHQLILKVSTLELNHLDQIPLTLKLWLELFRKLPAHQQFLVRI
jgi:hypothetical protein